MHEPIKKNFFNADGRHIYSFIDFLDVERQNIYSFLWMVSCVTLVKKQKHEEKKKKNPVKRAIRGGTNQIVPRIPLGRHRWAHTFYTGAKQRSPHVVCFDTLFVFLLVIKIINK